MFDRITVIGAGSWGTALSVLLAGKGYRIDLWDKDIASLEKMSTEQENKKYLPGVKLPDNINICSSLEDILPESKFIVLSVPAQALRSVLLKIKPIVANNSLFVNTAKGIEDKTLFRMSQVFEDVFGVEAAGRFAVLSGPSHAEEVGRGIPTAIVATAGTRKLAETVQDVFMTPLFRVYTNPDLIGVELAGSLKNVIALCTGVCDGLGYGDNTKAALITRGLAEITRLGVAMGAQPLTFAGLAGIGDLVVTCTSMHSRNRRAGIEIGKGCTTEEAVAKVQMVVEGITTTKAAYDLAQKYNVEMPITTAAYKVLFAGQNAGETVNQLMTRTRTHEMEEVAMQYFKEW